MLIRRFQGLATGLSDRMAEDSARFLSEETRMLVLGLEKVLWVCRFRHSFYALNLNNSTRRKGVGEV